MADLNVNVNTDIDKIDAAAADGMLGVVDSVAYLAAVVNRHAHNYERWFGKKTIPNAEISVATQMATYTNVAPVASFLLTSGNDNFGAWTQLLGSSDTPVIAPNAKYNLSEFAFSGNNKAHTYFIQVGFGVSGAAALAANTYTTVAPSFDAVNNSINIAIVSERQATGTKMWARILCPTHNAATVNLYFGLHEYIG
jgi:hypothetical protein